MSAFGLALPLIENLSNIGGTGDAAKERQRKDALHDYQQQERIGIQARVEGAKAAGLHPLAALGFQAGPGPTIPVGGTNFAPYAGALDKPERNESLEAAQIALLNAQTEEAQANARRANYALATQPGNGPPNMSQAAVLPTETQNTTGGNLLRGVKVVPNEIQSSANGVTMGTHPGGTEFNIPGGPSIMLPSKSLAEAAEDLDLLKYYMIATMNKDRLGTWLKEKISLPKSVSQIEVENLARRHPPKGVYRSNPRQHGGFVK